MAKDPAFLFYPGDWQGGTMYLTYEQKGCYIDLLVLQFNTGKFTEAQAKQVLSICFAVAWPLLVQKFKTDGTFYWNERLQVEIDRRKNFSNSRRNNALSQKKPKNGSEAYAKHMETENRNEIININSLERGVGENLYRIEDCLRIALSDPRWTRANKTSDVELNLFNEYLERLGKYEFNPLDYKSYFAKLKGRYPDLLKKEYSIEELRAMAREIDKQTFKKAV